MRLADLVAASDRAAATASRKDKIATLADVLGRTSDDEAPVAALWLSGALPQGRIGLGPAAVRDAWPEGAAASSGSPGSPGSDDLEILEVDAAFGRMAALEGAGAVEQRLAVHVEDVEEEPRRRRHARRAAAVRAGSWTAPASRCTARATTCDG